MTTILLKNSTVAGHAPTPSDLVSGELALNSADGKAFMKLEDGSVKELGGGSGPTPPVITPWVRNPCWLPMPATTAAMEQVDFLVCVYPESSYIAFAFNTSTGFNYQTDWGDGSAPVNVAANGAAQYLYDYNNPNLAGTNGPVTFTDSTDTVNRTAHGYTNGMKISFAEIVTTTGITQLQTYYVVNATANTFQLSATEGGAVLPLTTDGTGAILPYKQAMVKVTTTSGGLLTTVNTYTKNSTANLQNGYSQPILDMTISAGCTNLSIGSIATVVKHGLLERCTILRHNTTSFFNLFNGCTSLQSVVINDSSSVTNMQTMFNACSTLRTVPLFNTQNVTTMFSMFNGCTNLTVVPLFDTSSVTSMQSMFTNCYFLKTVPLFNTQNVTTTISMFSGCSSLESVPSFNLAKAIDGSGMFSACTNLKKVEITNTPLMTTFGSSTGTLGMFYNCQTLVTAPSFNTQNAGNMANMFNGCKNLESVPLYDTAKVTAFTNMFSICFSLVTVPLFNTQSAVDMASMFSSCISLISVPLFNTQNVNNMTNMFGGCSALQTVPLFNTVKVTTFSSMFLQCTNIGSIPAFATNAAAANAYQSMFAQCSSLQQVPDMNFSRAAALSSYSSMFSACPSLSKINLSPGNGPKFTFSVQNCKLSAASLNQLYTSLPTVSGQTITVTGNVGIAGDDPTIATAKGWTVSGS